MWAGASEAPVDLTPKQRQYLRALAHHLKPVVLVGAAGLSEAVLAKVGAELDNHELIKVKVAKEAPVDVGRGAGELAERTRSEVAQIIGRTVVLYRARAEKPTIVLPVRSES
jgi:RNA-binding protein